jgi:hypothetical protein
MRIPYLWRTLPGERPADSRDAFWRANVKKRPNADVPIRLSTLRQVAFSVAKHATYETHGFNSTGR